MDAVIAHGHEVVEHAGHEDPAGTEADRADLLAAGDVADGVECRQEALRVVVDAGVAHAPRRIAPAQHEDLQPTAHPVLDEAASGTQVEEVVPADRGRDDQDRALPHRGCGRRVLDQLGEGVALHHPARRRCEISAHLEGSAVGLRRHPAVASHIVQEILRTADDAASAGVEHELERGRVGGQQVRRCDRAHQDVHDEPRPLGLLPGAIALLEVVHEAGQGLARAQVLLAHAPEQRVVRPGRVGETPIALGRRAVRLPGNDADRVAAESPHLAPDAARLAECHSHALEQDGRGGNPDRFPGLYDAERLVLVSGQRRERRVHRAVPPVRLT